MDASNVLIWVAGLIFIAIDGKKESSQNRALGAHRIE